MAKQNWVTLNGISESDAYLLYDAQDTLQSVYVELKTIERLQVSGTGDNVRTVFSTPVVMTGNPDLMEKLKDTKRGDLVSVAGMITTTEKTRTYECPGKGCGHVFSHSGPLIYISPLYVEILDSGLTRDMAIRKLMRDRREVSNRAVVIGTLIEDPEYDDEYGDSELPRLSYQLRIPRSIRIGEESADEVCDFPYVEEYGKHAPLDRDALHKGSRVMITGHVRTNQVRHKVKCPFCGESFTFDDYPYVVINPSQTEYLSDCTIPGSEEDEVSVENAAWNVEENGK